MVDCITDPTWIVNLIHWRNEGLITHDTLIQAINYLATKVHVFITHGNGDCVI